MADQGELFQGLAGVEPSAPLATRMRPKTFDDLIGQRRVVVVLRDLVRSGALPSVRINPAGNSRLIRIPVAALRELAQQSSKRH